jgi:undecaprenyl-diphosphatase
MRPDLGLFDAELFYIINRGAACPALDAVMPVLSLVSEYSFSLALAVALAVLPRGDRRTPGIVYLAGLLVSGFVVFTLKHAFSREAPFVVLEYARQVLPEPDTGHSFPSGHATCAFMTAAVLSNYYRRLRILFLVALAAALGRVYSGVHYVSDVAAGAVIGTFTGYLGVYAAGKIGLSEFLTRPYRYTRLFRGQRPPRAGFFR